MSPLFSMWSRYIGHPQKTRRRKPSARAGSRQRTCLRLESLEGRTLLSAYVVTTTADSGPGSLRDAIIQVSNDVSHTVYPSPGNPNVDEIDFAITAGSDTGGGYNATTGVATITPQSGLRTITNAVFIDGPTQPGYSGRPLIQLNGVHAGGGVFGLDITAGNCTVRGLAIDQFTNTAIQLTGGGGNLIAGNYIGTDANGDAGLGNNGNGVNIRGSSGNTIGGTAPGDGNVISGNSGAGIGINVTGATGNLVQGNFIGTTVNGTAALANYAGVVISSGAANNTIGGSTAAARNIVSGNNVFGIWITNVGTNNNVIEGDYVGTDVTGEAAVPNNEHGGIQIDAGAQGNLIGTDGNGSPEQIQAERNLISGNNAAGLSIGAGCSNNVVAGNFIGTDATGTQQLPNSGGGIFTNGDYTFIGTTAAGVAEAATRNVILGLNLASNHNVVAGNFIGTDVTGTKAMGDNGAGMTIQDVGLGASDNTIGGTTAGAGNTIAFNPGGGVSVLNGSGNSILGNSIHDNGGRGIFLASGTNNNQAAPLLTSALSGLGFTVVTGTITSVPSAAVRVEFFANAAGDPEGRTLLGSCSVTTNAAGNGSFTAALAASLPAGQGLVTAAVTDSSGNTSAFSAGVVAAALSPASLSGVVWEDFNNDGQVDFGENGISGVTITLTGTDFLGRAVNQTQTTDSAGAYVFLNLLPGNYSLTETPPAGYLQGIDVVGTAGGSVSATDQFSVPLALGVNGLNYNFGEQPTATGPIQKGQTAGIGFWNNNNGQALIKALNGGTGTQLGDWLAATFPHMFGAGAGSDDLAAQNNAYVASYFQSQFIVHGQKLDAQVLATALAVYVTDPTLDSTGVGTQYGFIVSGTGLATTTYNVGTNGAAFGVADSTVMTVMDILLAADSQAVNGVLYNGDAVKRNKANNVFSAINQAGGA
jgi:hypothetical protein